MKGQWIGNYTGSSAGTIIVNIDERSSYFEGVAYLNEANTSIPSTVAPFKTNNKDHDFHFNTNLILPVNPRSGSTDSWPANIHGSWNADTLSLSWKTDIGAFGNCILPRSTADQPSELVPKEMEWKSFKEYVISLVLRSSINSAISLVMGVFHGQKVGEI